MKIARFWEKSEVQITAPSGKNFTGSAWGWSSSDPSEALKNAERAAGRVAHWLQNRESHEFEYGLDYPDRPPREEIVREIENDAGETVAIITRNATGALVLSTPSLVFIDVDIPPQSASGALGRSLKRLFGQPVEEPEQRVHKAISQAAMRYSQYSFRIYRTAAGFRCIVVNVTLSPESAASATLLQEFGADQLYKKLCLTQECYRARLTPKHWRCGAERPPNRFPWSNTGEEERFRRWQRGYEAKSASFAVCRFVEQIGTPRANAELQKLIDLHDEMSGVKSALPLA
jgi:hypothetical protein